MQNFLQFPLPAASFSPVLLGFICSNFLLFAFAYPIILELPGVSPLFLWRNEVAKNTFQNKVYFIKIYRYAFYAHNKTKKLDKDNMKNTFRSFRVKFITS